MPLLKCQLPLVNWLMLRAPQLQTLLQPPWPRPPRCKFLHARSLVHCCVSVCATPVQVPRHCGHCDQWHRGTIQPHALGQRDTDAAFCSQHG